MVNMPANYPINTLQTSTSNQFTNTGQQIQWTSNPNIQQQQANMFKMQTHNSSANIYPVQQPCQTEISHVSLAPQMMMSQGSVMASQPNLPSQNAISLQNTMMMSHDSVIASHGGIVSQPTFMATCDQINFN